jgi:uncharacterized Ntn-hydrolase superfamily protein
MPASVGRAVVAAALSLPFLPSSASATWSIMVLDRATGLIGVAGASCTFDVYGIAGYVPGKGAVISQSIGNPAARELALKLLDQGVALDSVVRVITAPAFDPQVEEQQYAMATLTGDRAQFTGRAMGVHYAGQRSAEGVLVQGNSLVGAAVLDRASAAVRQARDAGRPMEEVLMAGLEAGADAGGDARCGAQRATSAFLVVVKPDNKPHLPFLTLAVFGVERGGANAVDVLRSRLARWRATGGQMRVTTEWVQPDSKQR